MLPSAHVSKHHAEIYSDGLALRIRDLGSRNGTFVNRQVVTDAALHEQDVLHIGGHEFRVVRPWSRIDDDGRTCADAAQRPRLRGGRRACAS